MSATDRFLYSGVSCATNATPSSAAGDPARRPPSTVTSPADGTDRPTARFSSVLLPAPFGPTSATTRPAGTSSVHSRSAQVPRYRLPRLLASTTFIDLLPAESDVPLTVPGSRAGFLRPHDGTGSIEGLNPLRRMDDAHGLVSG